MLYFLVIQDVGVPEFGISTFTIAVILISAAVALIVPFAIVRKVFGNVAQARVLLATGEPAQGTVLKLWDTGTTVNDNPLVGLLLEVCPRDRAPYQVETKCIISRLAIPQVQPGSVVSVRVDPRDATKVALDLA